MGLQAAGLEKVYAVANMGPWLTDPMINGCTEIGTATETASVHLLSVHVENVDEDHQRTY